MNACVELRDAGKHFGADWVFRNVDLALPEGRTTAIVGESGSGKTTLLQLINAVLRADEGEVRVFGEPVPTTEVEHFRRRIGYAVQGAGLFPHMTVEQNMSLLARLERWDQRRIATRLDQLYRLVGLEPSLGDRFPHQLSGGQQQRVGLARAMMLEPPMWLLDEAFSAVDPITRGEIHEQFIELQRHEGVSTVLVTHDLREAARLSHYLVIMAAGEAGEPGRIVQHGETAGVLANPQEGYVARLLETQL